MATTHRVEAVTLAREIMYPDVNSTRLRKCIRSPGTCQNGRVCPPRGAKRDPPCAQLTLKWWVSLCSTHPTAAISKRRVRHAHRINDRDLTLHMDHQRKTWCVERTLRLFAFTLMIVPAIQAIAADGRMIRIPTRESATVPVFWAGTAGAPATVVLLPGGAGGIGNLNDSGWPGSSNFLIRSGKLFAAQGFNVAMVARPSDIKDLDYRIRTSEPHMDDLRNALLRLKKMSPAPIWLVGTSRGTISAAAFAISEKNTGLVDGVVLTASVTNFKYPGAVPTQDLEKIKVPVLVLHHDKDACVACRPYEVSHIMDKLTNAPVRKQIMVNGGTGAVGDPCEAEHWHGFIGMEQDAVELISNWIKKPAP